MSRKGLARNPTRASPRGRGAAVEPTDCARVAEEIGIAALKLAQRAHAAGLTSIGYFLETVAIQAGAEAATRQWPSDPTSK